MMLSQHERIRRKGGMNSRGFIRMYVPLLAAGLFFGIAFCGSGRCQSLSFSQVLMVNDVEDTVPPGKVWKVESFMQKDNAITDGTTTSCLSSRIRPVVMNGNYYFPIGVVSTGMSTSIASMELHFPIWSPAGTRWKTLCPGDYLSIVEFNITP